jgi:gliding motility-associated-like protein
MNAATLSDRMGANRWTRQAAPGTPDRQGRSCLPARGAFKAVLRGRTNVGRSFLGPSMRTIPALLALLALSSTQAQVCDPNGNLFLLSNYDGGIVTINVDVNIPNLVIGISTYEPVQVTITGPFAGNVSQVLYSGMNSNQNNNNCGQGNFTTSVTGVPANLVTINPPLQPLQVGYAPAHGNGTGSWGGVVIGAIGICDTLVNTGGVNTPDELVFHFETQTGASLYAHYSQYACWQNSIINVSGGGTCCIDVSPPVPPSATICDPNGNLVIYSNYEGGVLTINVDQNIPNLRVGICSYEALTVNITGPFVANVSEVIYAGFDGTNGPCSNNPPTTTISGVSPGIVTMYSSTLGNIAIANYLGEELFPGFNVVNCITGAEGACSTSTQGGGNSAPQLVQFFLAEFGAGTSLFAHQVQYGCFNGTFNVSAGGNCCLTNPGTPPNPIYIGNATYDLIPWTDSLLCGGSITIDLSYYTGIYSVLWSDGSTAEALTITAPGTYTVEVGDYCHYPGATLLVDTVVVLPCCQPGPVNTVVDGIDCGGALDGGITVTPLGLNGPFTFAWNTSPPQSTSTITGLGPGTYSVVVSDGAGCDTTLSFALTEPPLLEVEATGEQVLCPAQAGAFNAVAQGGTGAIAFSWSNGATGPAIEQAFDASAVLVATATDANGCVAVDTLTILVQASAEGLFVPNVFTPDGDGINDTFILPGASGQGNTLMRIFNRWGQLVFSTNDLLRGWNGRGQGDVLPSGVYMYLIEVDDPCLGEGTQKLRGHVTLLR